MDRRKMAVFVCCVLAPLSVLLSRPVPCAAIENSECLECHSDSSLKRSESEGMKEGLYLDSTRFKFSVHNINSITCVDCHADIEVLDYDNEVPHATSLAPVNCDGCHEAEGEAYLNSVHRKARGKGITIPCYACHGYHYVTHLEANSVFERENAFCLKCHNPNNFHDWLPQKETHFAFVECAVCHALDAPRYVALRFFDLVRGDFLDGDDFLQALNTDYDAFMPLVDKNSDKVINIDEFENIVLLLRQQDILGSFHGEVVASMVPTVHHVNRGQANRDCEQCHNPQSLFFQDVQICINRADGSRQHHIVERRVLESYYVSHFYALGGTRIRLLDRIGFILLAGGISVVIGHLSVRLLTAPGRRQRAAKDKEKR
jgi:predicted CXXCH cytochrome family protein